MTNTCLGAPRARPTRRLTLFASALLLWHGGQAFAQGTQPTQPTQIPMSKAQAERSGIETSVAVPAGESIGGPAAAGDGQHLSGTVVTPPDTLAVVSTPVGGIVRQLMVSTLQTVGRNTPVATLYSQPLMEMQREYLQLTIQARLARDKQARDERLFEKGIIARSRVHESRGAAMQAELAARERRQALRAAGMGGDAIQTLASSNQLSPQLSIVAGAPGTVVSLDIRTGQRVEAGMPIASISSGAALWVELQASRQQAAQIHVGDPVQIKGCEPAKVIALAPQVNASNQSTVVRAALPAGATCVKPNQYIEAIHGGAGVAPDSVGVPAAAIVRHGGNDFVFVRNAQGFEALRVSVRSEGADRAWLKPVDGKLVAGTAVATKGIVALKGSWLGLGAETRAASGAAESAQAGVK